MMLKIDFASVINAMRYCHPLGYADLFCDPFCGDPTGISLPYKIFPYSTTRIRLVPTGVYQKIHQDYYSWITPDHDHDLLLSGGNSEKSI